MGYNGVVVTDALEMDSIAKAGLVPGEKDSAEYFINIAAEVINSGVDILLLPMDLKNAQAVNFYDEYIAGIAAKVSSGEISQSRIDESVTRILTLKSRHGMLDEDGISDIEKKVSDSITIVGSKEHHDTEMDIARQAITVVKNADAIVLAYMGSALGTDPTDKTDSGSGLKAINANIVAAIETVFGSNEPKGHLPVNIPDITENSDGSLSYSTTNLYDRGFGVTY